MPLRVALIVAAITVAIPLAVEAGPRQPPGRQGLPQGAGRPGAGRQGVAQPVGISPAELQDLMDALVVSQAERDLQLSDEQFAAFLKRLRALQTARRRSENQRNRALMELRRFVQGEAAAGSAGDEGIRARLKALDDAEAQGATDVRQARSALEQILDPRQQARFRLLEEQIERRKLDLFARSRRPLARPQ